MVKGAAGRVRKGAPKVQELADLEKSRMGTGAREKQRVAILAGLRALRAPQDT